MTAIDDGTKPLQWKSENRPQPSLRPAGVLGLAHQNDAGWPPKEASPLNDQRKICAEHYLAVYMPRPTRLKVSGNFRSVLLTIVRKLGLEVR